MSKFSHWMLSNSCPKTARLIYVLTPKFSPLAKNHFIQRGLSSNLICNCQVQAIFTSGPSSAPGSWPRALPKEMVISTSALNAALMIEPSATFQNAKIDWKEKHRLIWACINIVVNFRVQMASCGKNTFWPSCIVFFFGGGSQNHAWEKNKQ